VKFRDRVDAGRRLGTALKIVRGEAVVVLGLARGGVPVAAQVAAALDAPLDVVVVRKLGVPYQPELAMGAVAEDGIRVIDAEAIRRAGVTATELAAVETREQDEVRQRVARYRQGRPPASLGGQTAIVVDDGIATGSTARAACRLARARGAARVVLAVPVAPPGWRKRIGGDADTCLALSTPDPFYAVGEFYDDFDQVGEDEVIAWLGDCSEAPRAAGRRTPVM
jgi:predicted phosphoribosyltransferase